jgi:hypothetical protein
MIRVVDNFYDDPDKIVEQAKASKYQLISNGNYPGKDGLNRLYTNPELERKLGKLFPGPRYKMICSRFRYALEGDTYMSYVHSDNWGIKSGWHVLIYLTKNAASKDGLTLYETKYGQRYWKDEAEEHTWDFPEWKPWKTHKYKYNQAVIIDYCYFHAPMNRGGFGKSFDDCRLLHIIEIIDTNRPANKDRSFVKCVSMPEKHHPDGGYDDDQSSTWSDSEATSYERVEHLEHGIIVD